MSAVAWDKTTTTLNVWTNTGVSDTASLLYQTNWSGHPEMGLAGNDDFAIKVSADGTTFTEALRIDATTGAVSLPTTGSRHIMPNPSLFHVHRSAVGGPNIQFSEFKRNPIAWHRCRALCGLGRQGHFHPCRHHHLDPDNCGQCQFRRDHGYRSAAVF